MSLKEIWYSATAIAMGAQTSFASMTDGTMTVKLSVPVELGGSGGTGANPEQLVAMGYASSLLAAMKAISLRRGIALPNEVSVVAEVGLGPGTGGGINGLAFIVAIHVNLPGMARAVAESLVNSARIYCPYCNGSRLKVDVEVKLA